MSLYHIYYMFGFNCYIGIELNNYDSDHFIFFVSLYIQAYIDIFAMFNLNEMQGIPYMRKCVLYGSLCYVLLWFYGQYLHWNARVVRMTALVVTGDVPSDDYSSHPDGPTSAFLCSGSLRVQYRTSFLKWIASLALGRYYDCPNATEGFG